MSIESTLVIAQNRKKVNPQVKAFSESTQNFLQQQLVSAVGSRESVSKGASNCCTVCSEFTSDRLSLDSLHSINHKKRRKAVWESTKELEDTLCKKLKDERTLFINQHEHFKMLCTVMYVLTVSLAIYVLMFVSFTQKIY